MNFADAVEILRSRGWNVLIDGDGAWLGPSDKAHYFPSSNIIELAGRGTTKSPWARR